jgi:hypothetical protein
MRGVSDVHLDGGRDAQALRFESDLRRTVGVHGIIKRFAEADGVVSIETPCSGKCSRVKARWPIGAAVLACELARLPRSTVDLGRLQDRGDEA